MDPDSWEAQRSSFGTAAALYDRVRPHYRADAIRWALADTGAGAEVVDLGAGTGILSRQLIELGYSVTPVEPDEAMRAQCDAALRSAFGATARTALTGSGGSDGSDGSGERTAARTALAGSAEQIPLPDESADAVIAGQAYHWFDPAKAHPEIARVLRPGGVFAPIWNIRDESEPWVAELTRVLRSQDGSGIHAGWQGVTLEDRFTGTEQATFHHAVRHTPDSLLDLLRSRSYYLTGDAERRKLLERELRELIATRLAGQDEFDLPYVTVAYRARRR
ncbi:MAG: class I SAM-dependent methyltransferase [Micromonosporaceae bacterium]